MPVSNRAPEEFVQSRESADSSRVNAVVAGVLLIVATAASLASGPFLAPVTDSDSLGDAAAHQGQVATGVLLVFIAALAAPGIAVALYPVLRRFGEGLSLGAVAFRTMEGVFYALGMLVLLSLTTLSEAFVDAGSPNDQHFTTLGQTMLAQYHWLVEVGLMFACKLKTDVPFLGREALEKAKAEGPLRKLVGPGRSRRRWRSVRWLPS